MKFHEEQIKRHQEAIDKAKKQIEGMKDEGRREDT